TLGATFVARGFSGDREQLVPMLKAGLAHSGFAFIDVISPCVTFNDHVGSTKSYRFTREHMREVVSADFVSDGPPDLVPLRSMISAAYEPGTAHDVRMHDGSTVRLRKVAEDFDPTDRHAAYAYIRGRQHAGEIPTGLLYMDAHAADMHEMEGTCRTPLTKLEHEALCPGAGALDALMEEFR
ncbi:MAG TPA: hypothetical protein VHG09_00680, partial [Longimicrobiales bacterium]|nr:hypothetical protein [Longimicrobiales bacterium]